MVDFVAYRKIPRWSREVAITEKIDGSNGVIHFTEDGVMSVGSRNRWLTPNQDNHGFEKWAREHEEELRELGKGYHFGEWWGQGIQRNYGLKEKRFSLFNVKKWLDNPLLPKCCGTVPIIRECSMDVINTNVESTMRELEVYGSIAAPGYMNPEGIVICHLAGNVLFKKTYTKDTFGKECTS